MAKKASDPNTSCPQCSGDLRTKTDGERTFDKCTECGYVVSESIEPVEKK